MYRLPNLQGALMTSPLNLSNPVNATVALALAKEAQLLNRTQELQTLMEEATDRIELLTSLKNAFNDAQLAKKERINCRELFDSSLIEKIDAQWPDLIPQEPVSKKDLYLWHDQIATETHQITSKLEQHTNNYQNTNQDLHDILKSLSDILAEFTKAMHRWAEQAAAIH